MRIKHFLFVVILLLLAPNVVQPQSVSFPAGFTSLVHATGLNLPTTMAFAPDGTIFVTEQQGNVRVIKDGQMLPQPFLTVNVDWTQERGLLGVAFDPQFETNQYVYIYYTTAAEPKRNIVSRFTADGDVAVPGSETIILELDLLSLATNHNGGAIHFGPDDKLYIAVGDNANASNSQLLQTLHGKILRINADGSIPTDNPFFAQTTGKNQTIWALGLRNPYNFAFQPGTGQMLVNDVGQNSWEEINAGSAGANYGWPATEGYTDNPAYVSPVFAYPHNGEPIDTGCSIVGGDFYSSSVTRFPAAYDGDYFFADYCNGWIKHYDPTTGVVNVFASGLAFGLVDVKISSDGYLYYLEYGVTVGQGVLHRVSYLPAEPALQAPLGMVTDSRGNPTYVWEQIEGATTYDLYVHRGTDVNNRVLYEIGLTTEQLGCDGSSCYLDATTLPGGGPYWLRNDTYSVWWRPNTGYWLGPFTFEMAVPPPALASNFTIGQGANNQTHLSWQADTNAGWYRVWVGTTGEHGAVAAHFEWHEASTLGCINNGVCTLSLVLNPDDYIWYVLGWSPGGFSVGGIQGWAEGTTFTVP